MTKQQHAASLILTVLLGAGAIHGRAMAQRGAQGPLPTIVILATGGTIAGAAATDVRPATRPARSASSSCSLRCLRRRSWPSSRASRSRTSAPRT